MISRREFIAATGAAVSVSSIGGAAIPESASGGAALSKSAAAAIEKSARLFLPDDDLKPATYDRLPLEWHKQRAKLLQEKLAQEGRDGILLTDRWNIIYFTGLLHTTTQRLIKDLIPTTSQPDQFYDKMNILLIKTSLNLSSDTHFDFPHAMQ